MRLRLVSCAIAAAALVLGFAQTIAGQAPRDPAALAPAGQGVIAGIVVTPDTGRPLRQARVTLAGGDVRVARFVVTDDQGRFSFAELSPGEFALSASRPGFLDVTYGQKRPGSGRPGTPIRLAPSQKLDRLTLTMPRGAVITGTVVDDAGEVSFGTTVQALRFVMRSGVRTPQVVRTATTDDRGIYRIPVLPPGDYLILAMPRSSMIAADEIKARVELVVAEAAKAGKASAEQAMTEAMAMQLAIARGPGGEEPMSGYAPVLHPSAMQVAGATTLTLDVGEERSGADVRLQLVPLSRISGIVSAESALPSGTQVSLIDLQAMPGTGTRTARSGPDGSFSFGGLPPGQYLVTARATILADGSGNRLQEIKDLKVIMDAKIADGPMRADPRPLETLWAMTEVAVNGGVVPTVSLGLRRGMTVSGAVAFDTPTGASLDLSKLRLTLAPAGVSQTSGEGMVVRDVAVGADGQFVIRSVVPGSYRVVPSVGVPPGFLIESSVFGGRDVLDIPLEVKPGEDVGGGVLTFSTRAAELTGALTDLAGKPAPGYTLVLFSADNRYWLPQSRRIQASRPASDGRFSFRSLPPGDYRLIAVEDVEPGQWFDPAFLKELIAGSMPVTLGKGEKRTQDVRIGR